MAIFLLPIPVSVPGRVVGVSALFRVIFYLFEAIRDEYLSHMQWLCKGGHFVHFTHGINWPHVLNRRTIGIYKNTGECKALWGRA